jgi:hypothetical protein
MQGTRRLDQFATLRDVAMDDTLADIAQMLRALPVVPPALGRCAPIEPSDLTYRRGHEYALPAPEIATDRLQTFPDFIPPLLPAAAAHEPSPTVTALLAPPPVDAPMPWGAKRRERRAGAIALDVLVVFALAAIVLLHSPLARVPQVRPYSQAANGAIARQVGAARPVVARAVHAVTRVL